VARFDRPPQRVAHEAGQRRLPVAFVGEQPEVLDRELERGSGRRRGRGYPWPSASRTACGADGRPAPAAPGTPGGARAACPVASNNLSRTLPADRSRCGRSTRGGSRNARVGREHDDSASPRAPVSACLRSSGSRTPGSHAPDLVKEIPHCGDIFLRR
jgi:hypothetical protein